MFKFFLLISFDYVYVSYIVLYIDRMENIL